MCIHVAGGVFAVVCLTKRTTHAAFGLSHTSTPNPTVSMILSFEFVFESKVASAGNRTRAARVAGEHSTTEPPMRTLAQGSNVE